mmetsp:Transcript_10065/g.11164  ORF Transcript_10065/g.11164 Transcript_10065/m.11164 type:complete len:172 (-) Transcript_10065:37-552(-)
MGNNTAKGGNAPNFVDSDVTAAEDDKRFKPMREKIDAHAKARGEFYDAAAKAHDAKDGAKAKELSLKGKEQGELMKKAQEDLALAVFKYKNDALGDGEIDLHGLSTDQALQFLDERIEKVKGSGELNVITGAGKHSGHDGPKIKPAVLSHLKKGGYNFKQDDNGGSIIVTV